MSGVTLHPVTGRRKAHAAATTIRELASSMGPGWKLPTVVEMCKSLNVAFGTLDAALTRLERQGLIERKRGSGIYVSDRIHQKTIGVVFGGDIFSEGFSPFWSLMLLAVRQQAGDHRFTPRAFLDVAEGRDGLGGHAQLMEDLESRRLHGLLLFAPLPGQAATLRSYGVPLVVLCGEDPQDPTVTMDMLAVHPLAARELAARGCRRVALMAHHALPHRPALEGELARAGAPDAEVVDWSYDTWAGIIPGAGTRERLAHELARRMIAERHAAPLPDGVLSLDDTMARGLVIAMQQAGLRPGRDVHVASVVHTGSPVLDLFARELIPIEYDPARIVRAMLTMLGELTAGRTLRENPVLIGPSR